MAKAYRTDHLEHAIWGYAAETGLHGLRIITSGVLDQFPKLQIVLGHMGEGIPYWFYRLDYMHGRVKIGFDRPHSRAISESSPHRRDESLHRLKSLRRAYTLRFQRLRHLAQRRLMNLRDAAFVDTQQAADFLHRHLVGVIHKHYLLVACGKRSDGAGKRAFKLSTLAHAVGYGLQPLPRTPAGARGRDRPAA